MKSSSRTYSLSDLIAKSPASVLANLAHCLHEILVQNIFPFRPDSKESSFSAHIPQISTIEPIRKFHNSLVVNLAVLGYRVCMDFQHLHPCLLIWQRDLNFTVQPAGPQQSRIQGVGPIGGHDHFHLPKNLKAIHLVQQLHQSSLNLLPPIASISSMKMIQGWWSLA